MSASQKRSTTPTNACDAPVKKKKKTHRLSLYLAPSSHDDYDYSKRWPELIPQFSEDFLPCLARSSSYQEYLRALADQAGYNHPSFGSFACNASPCVIVASCRQLAQELLPPVLEEATPSARVIRAIIAALLKETDHEGICMGSTHRWTARYWNEGPCMKEKPRNDAGQFLGACRPITTKLLTERVGMIFEVGTQLYERQVRSKDLRQLVCYICLSKPALVSLVGSDATAQQLYDNPGSVLLLETQNRLVCYSPHPSMASYLRSKAMLRQLVICFARINWIMRRPPVSNAVATCADSVWLVKRGSLLNRVVALALEAK
jgi:hypothetical protein